MIRLQQVTNTSGKRRGAVLVLVAVLLVIFVMAAALTVDVSYMQLVRTDLRIATDAATKAGAEALARTENPDEARAVAVKIAGMHSVAGHEFAISTSDIQLGHVAADNLGQWVFTENKDPLNSVRIHAKIAESSATKPVPLFFSPAFGFDDFTTSRVATATRQDVEVCLALDRSGSMLWDMSGYSWSYPSGNPLLSSWRSWGTMWRNHLSAPHPTNSRWAILSDAVKLFLEEAGKYDPPPRVSLVTWANGYTMPIRPYTYFPTSEVDVPMPSMKSHIWNTNVNDIYSALDSRGSNPMMGGTNLSAGIDTAVDILTSSESQLSNKVVIVLTDGQWGFGRDPVEAAFDATPHNIKVHAISMNGGSEQTCSDIARVTGGSYYSANNQEQLKTAFKELAKTLPVVLIE